MCNPLAALFTVMVNLQDNIHVNKVRTMILCQHLLEMLDITFYTGMTENKLQILIVSDKTHKLDRPGISLLSACHPSYGPLIRHKLDAGWEGRLHMNCVNRKFKNRWSSILTHTLQDENIPVI